ncbi:phosphatase PAP2 family protein [Marinomonas mediterranea]|jgi:PAP2 superfamily.|uniref:Phosphatidic acid phosphatase type 2/haloperoxidase domain-containing protein n=1 Tax=Marinomonas mediterranea (strain ATCC 700492 / JCM 21426 / NBRC 103028 / MMB-1) TaxID=717774 RepID=F2JV53_MARM1|nr:phosphatase PAP2 family protein [Marinomonas mediterranea]ADZ92811.1 hypothetical protein Marme_3598 [Marinomonas mediterranea MMB-1]WCN10744.1 hypothetical protein GV055_18360 [Marinomonas mediterranea]WCN14801.1 hypothetical protein GV054_18235 [Marinomonas mediterranea]WCN18834.1 hypothetical protein GV053_18225 [Marinomonas mediterranea MMB-1]
MKSIQHYWMRLAGVLIVLIGAPSAYAEDGFWGQLYGEVVQDYKSFYTTSTLGDLAPGLLVAGVMANSNMDGYIQEEIPHHDDNFKYDSRQVNYFGDSTRTIPSIPIYLGVMGLDHWLNDGQESIYGEWGRYSFRTFMVGAPSGFLAANILGGSRPTEGRDSDWRLFDDVNSISGHSFSGAVPMINAAMLADGTGMKTLFYGLSILPGLARVAMDKHYASQALLGWTFAYVSAKVVHQNRADIGVSLSYYRDAPVLTLIKKF